MYHFYVDKCNIDDGRIRINGQDVNHIKNVLRMREGEKIIVCDGEGTEYTAAISSMYSDEITADIISCEKSGAESNTRIYLFQGLPKKDKMELIIQKAIELGVYEIIPVMTKRVIVKLEDKKREEKKLERWRTIAESAAKQSGRGIIPHVSEVVSFKDAVKRAGELDVSVIPYEKADGGADGMSRTREIIRGMRGGKSVGVFIGPEGGFEEDEIELAGEAGISAISLGKRILRTETAGIMITAVIMFETEGVE